MARQFRVIGRKIGSGKKVTGKWLDMSKCSISYAMAIVLGAMSFAYDVQIEYRKVM